MRSLTLPILLAGLISAASSAADAHPALLSTAPPADKGAGAAKPEGTGTSPRSLRLTFSEGVIAKFSGLEVKDETGRKVAIGAAATDPSDAKQLVVPLAAPLAAGRYSVEWHAVAEDTHRVKGRYSFTVAR